jgi:hypothetical protein
MTASSPVLHLAKYFHGKRPIQLEEIGVYLESKALILHKQIVSGQMQLMINLSSGFLQKISSSNI